MREFRKRLANFKKTIITNKILIIGISLCGLYWIFESLIHTLIFKIEDSFFQHLFTRDIHEEWMRLFVVALITLFSIYTQKLLNKRGKLNQRLNMSEKKYRTLIENAQEGIWVIDENELTTFTNQKMTEMLGYNIDEMLGKHLFSFMDDEGIEICKKNLERRKQGIKEQQDFEFLTKDGEKIYTLIETSPILDSNDNYIGAVAFVTDITERRKAVKALRKSEFKYRSLFDNMLDGFALCKIITDNNNNAVDFVYLEVNDSFERLTGLEKEKIIGKRVTEVIPGIEHSKPNLFEIYGKVALTGESTRFEIFFEPLKIWLLISVYSLKKGRFVTIFDNITERKKVEEELQEAKKFLSNIFTSIQDGISIIDSNFNIISVNPAIESWYSNSKPLVGKKCYEVYQHKTKPCEGCPSQITIETGKTAISLVSKKRIDGIINGTLEVFTFPLIDQETGKVRGVIEYIRDVTERKKAEEKLKESEEKYRTLVKTSPNSIILLDLKGNIIDCNNFTEFYFGLAREEIINKNFTDLYMVPNEKKHIILKQALKRIKNQITDPIEFSFINKKGETVWLMNFFSFVKIGDHKYIQFVSEDITKRKEVENMIKKQIEKLKELDQVKNEFVYRASHELKTPLTSIYGASELLMKYYGDSFDDRAKALVDIINNGGKRLNNLIGDLIDVSKMESGKLELKKQKENIVEIIKNCLNDMLFLAKERDLSLSFDFQRDIYIEVDKIRIEQVIMNLISNAIKNTPPKGILSINLKEHNGFVNLKISDTGVGFTEEEKEKVFKKFGKIERYGKGMDILTEGSGLGLFISKEIVNLHHGEIWLESEGRNKGSTFIVRVPSS